MTNEAIRKLMEGSFVEKRRSIFDIEEDEESSGRSSFNLMAICGSSECNQQIVLSKFIYFGMETESDDRIIRSAYYRCTGCGEMYTVDPLRVDVLKGEVRDGEEGN